MTDAASGDTIAAVTKEPMYALKTDSPALGKGVVVGDLEEVIDALRTTLTSGSGERTVTVRRLWSS